MFNYIIYISVCKVKTHTVLASGMILLVALIFIPLSPVMALPIPELDELPEDKQQEICVKLVAAKAKGAKIPYPIMWKLCD